MSNTELVRAPLYVGLGVIAVVVLFVLLVSDSDESEVEFPGASEVEFSDESEVEFDVLNATFKVGCTSPWKNEGGPITFSDGEWAESLYEDGNMPRRSATITEIVVDSVDRAIPGEEVIVEVQCQSDGYSSPRFGVEVHVFAGNSRAPRRLGQPVVGFLEEVQGDLGGSMPQNGFVSTRVWETLDTDSRCCPSKYVIVNRYRSDGDWVEHEREVWERTVYDW